MWVCIFSYYHNIIGTAPRKENEPHRSVEQAAEDETGQNDVLIVQLHNVKQPM